MMISSALIELRLVIEIEFRHTRTRIRSSERVRLKVDNKRWMDRRMRLKVSKEECAMY